MEDRGKLSLEQINRVVDSLLPVLRTESEDRGILFACGQIYLAFLQGEKSELSLTLPSYNAQFRESICNYLHYIWILHTLGSKSTEILDDNLELFDYFSYLQAEPYERSTGQFALELLNKEEDYLVFEGKIRVGTDRFVPLFAKGSIENHEAEIFSGFPLFSSIAREGLFPYPVLLDLDKDSLLLLHNNMPSDTISLLLENVNSSAFDDDADRDGVLESLIEREITGSISIGYPYHSNINPIISRVMADRSRFLEVKMFTRLFYKEIPDHALVLLPYLSESTMSQLTERLLNLHEISATQHKVELFHAMGKLKEHWKSSGLNYYHYPFPSKWIMLIHKGETLEFYLSLAKADFPAVTGRLMADFEEVIRLVYDVNWLETYLYQDRNVVLLLPSLSAYPKIVQSARDFLSTRFKSVEDEQSYQCVLESGQSFILLNPFNKILIANALFNSSQNRIRLAVPDFIYFACQPFMAFYIAKYIYDPLIKGARSEFDSQHDVNLVKWKQLSAKLIALARTQMAKYIGFYIAKPEIPELPPIEDEISAQGLSNDEVRELLTNKNDRQRHKMIEIATTDGKIHHLTPNAKVLINIQGEILQITANEVISGQHFATSSGFFKQIDKQAIASKLTQISDEAKNWKKSLVEKSGKEHNLYNLLQERGLSIKPTTFESNYLDRFCNGEHLSLPRSRKDWQIVGDYLGISDIAGAWINHKGWSSQNSLRQAYEQVIKAVLDHYASEMESENTLINRVNDLIQYTTGVVEDPQLQKRDAKAVIELISACITFHEILKINRK